MFVYLDKSGDLGFNFSTPETSQYFLVTALTCSDRELIERAVRKFFRELPKAELSKHQTESQTVDGNLETRQQLLRLLSELDIKVLAVLLDKRQVLTDIAKEPDLIYVIMVNALMNNIFSTVPPPSKGHVHLITSQQVVDASFNDRLASSVVAHAKVRLGISVKIDFKDKAEQVGLQAAEIASESIFANSERNDPSLMELLGSCLVEVHQVMT